MAPDSGDPGTQDTDTTGADTTGADTAVRYEQLRAVVLSGQAQGWRLGWGVLAGRGMAAWVNAQQQIPLAPRPDQRQCLAQRAGAPVGQAAELVRVLARMALAHIPPHGDQPPSHPPKHPPSHPESDRGAECDYQQRERGGQGHPRAPAA